ncbi:BTB/POZ protein [Rhizophagus irregularis DAOM 181602=DAOM 197198]|nr:BTB/POZ protein [Rhizophagus irregularis DAOM 181602=DAOM 197198]
MGVIAAFHLAIFVKSSLINTTSIRNNKTNDLVHIKLPNISPEIFQIILKYIYGDPSSKPTDDIPLPRNLKIDGIFNSSFIDNLSIISTISRRIDKIDNNDAIISNIEKTGHAIYYGNNRGPHFGDIIICSNKGENTDYDYCCYKKRYYEKKIRDIEDKFSIEDYEVFQIIK